MPNLGNLSASTPAKRGIGPAGDHMIRHSPSSLDRIGSQIVQVDNPGTDQHYNSFGSPSRSPAQQYAMNSGQVTPNGGKQVILNGSLHLKNPAFANPNQVSAQDIAQY